MTARALTRAALIDLYDRGGIKRPAADDTPAVRVIVNDIAKFPAPVIEAGQRWQRK